MKLTLISTQLFVLWFLNVTDFVDSFSKSPHQCSPLNECTVGDDVKFSYNTSFTYVYEYTSQVDTYLYYESSHAPISLKATVSISPITNCLFSMQLENIELKEPASERQPSALEKHALHFEFQDGVIDVICPSLEEPTWVVNIKRGILSLVQNSASWKERRETLTDADILGKCETQYTVRHGRKDILVERKKNLDKCSHSVHVISQIQTNPLTSQAVQSAPIFRGTQRCEQMMSAGILQEVICQEVHELRPLSGRRGATSKISQTLRFIQISPTDPLTSENQNGRVQKALLFDHPNDKMADQETSSLDQLLLNLCNDAMDGISPKTVPVFNSILDKLLRHSTDQLTQMITDFRYQCPTNKRAMDILMEAIAQMDTPASLRFMTQLVVAGEYLGSVTIWLARIGLLAEPSIEMIDALVPLLRSSSVAMPSLLTLSALVGVYCRNNPSCTQERVINEIIAQLDENMAEGCRVRDPNQQEKILFSLKSIGNIGHFESFLPKLHSCLVDPVVPNYIQVAAVEAHRRFSCRIPKNVIFDKLAQPEVASEVRISAYLELMRCPNKDVVDAVYNLLANETINQVGSFIWTHLTNLRDSSDPCAFHVQHLLVDRHLRTKFSTDARKFSRAFHNSVFSEVLNAGVHSEVHVIFPTDSYLPTSIMVNLTIDIFGRSVNLFEVSGHIEGLEPLIESVFGPDGLIPLNPLHTQLNGLKEKALIDHKKLKDLSEKHLRSSRFVRDPLAVGSIKIFGQEVLILSNSGAHLLAFLRQKMDLQHVLTTLANERQGDVTRVTRLLDFTMVTSTGAGLPLRLSASATAGTSVEWAGRVDLRRLINARTCDIEGHVKPSILLEVRGTVDVNGIGIQMASTLRSSTLLDGRVEVRGSRMGRIHLNFPRDKLELVDFQHELFNIRGLDKYPIDGIQKDKVDASYCSHDLTSRPLGVQFCAEMLYPNASRVEDAPYFPLTGPAKVKLYVERMDPTLTVYQGEFRWEKDILTQETNGKAKHSHNYLFTLKTPRSTQERELTAEFLLNELERVISVRLVTPIKKVILDGKYIHEPEHLRLDALLDVDSSRYTVFADLTTKSTDHTYKLTPTFHMTLAGRPLVSVTGLVVLEVDQKLTVDLKIDHLTDPPTTLKGEINRRGQRLDWDFNLDCPLLLVQVQGYYQVTGPARSISCLVAYTWPGSIKEQIEFLSKTWHLTNQNLRRLNSTTHLTLSQFPQLNTFLSWTLLSATGHVESVVQVGLGPMSHFDEHKVTLTNLLSYGVVQGRININGTLSVVYPVKEVEVSIILKHQVETRMTTTQLAIQVDASQKMALLVDVTKGRGMFNCDVNLKLPTRTLWLLVNVREEEPREYAITGELHWSPDGRVLVKARYCNWSHRQQLFYSFTMNGTIPDDHSFKLDYAFLIRENHLHLLTSLALDRVPHSMVFNLTRPQQGRFEIQGIVQWDETMSTGNANITLGDENEISFDLLLGPERQVKGYAAVKVYDDVIAVDVDVLWDAKRDRMDRFMLRGKYRRLDAIERKGEAMVSFRGTTITARMESWKDGYFASGPLNYKFKGYVEWDPTKRISVAIEVNRMSHGYRREFRTSVTLHTPFEGFGRNHVALNHVVDDIEWELRVVLKGDGREIQSLIKTNYLLNSRRLETHVKVFMEGWKPVDAKGWVLCDEVEVKSQGSVRWGDGQEVALNVHAVEVSQNFARLMMGGFNLTTPWEDMREVSIALKHVVTETSFDSGGEVRWQGIPRLGCHLSGHRHPHDSKLRIQLIAGKQEMKLDATDSANHSMRVTKALVGWNDGQEVEMEVKRWKEKRQIGTSVHVATPFSILKTFEGRHSHDGHSINSEVHVHWPKGDPLSIVLVGQRSPDVNVKVTIATPWEGTANLYLRHKMTAHRMNTSVDVSVNDKTLAFTIMGKKDFSRPDGHLVQGSINLQTPFSALREVSVSVVHTRHKGTLVSRGDLWLNDNRMNVHHELHFQDLLNVNSTVVFATPMNILLNGTLVQIHRPKELSLASVQVDWGKDQRVKATAEYSKGKGLLHLQTPFSQIQELDFQFITLGNESLSFLAKSGVHRIQIVASARSASIEVRDAKAVQWEVDCNKTKESVHCGWRGHKMFGEASLGLRIEAPRFHFHANAENTTVVFLDAACERTKAALTYKRGRVTKFKIDTVLGESLMFDFSVDPVVIKGLMNRSLGSMDIQWSKEKFFRFAIGGNADHVSGSLQLKNVLTSTFGGSVKFQQSVQENRFTGEASGTLTEDHLVDIHVVAGQNSSGGSWIVTSSHWNDQVVKLEAKMIEDVLELNGQLNDYQVKCAVQRGPERRLDMDIRTPLELLENVTVKGRLRNWPFGEFILRTEKLQLRGQYSMEGRLDVQMETRQHNVLLAFGGKTDLIHIGIGKNRYQVEMGPEGSFNLRMDSKNLPFNQLEGSVTRDANWIRGFFRTLDGQHWVNMGVRQDGLDIGAKSPLFGVYESFQLNVSSYLNASGHTKSNVILAFPENITRVHLAVNGIADWEIKVQSPLSVAGSQPFAGYWRLKNVDSKSLEVAAEVSVSQGSPFGIKGHVANVPSETFDVGIHLITPHETVFVNGSIKYNSGFTDIKPRLIFTTSTRKFEMNGYLSQKPGNISGRVDVDQGQGRLTQVTADLIWDHGAPDADGQLTIQFPKWKINGRGSWRNDKCQWNAQLVTPITGIHSASISVDNLMTVNQSNTDVHVLLEDLQLVDLSLNRSSYGRVKTGNAQVSLASVGSVSGDYLLTDDIWDATMIVESDSDTILNFRGYLGHQGDEWMQVLRLENPLCPLHFSLNVTDQLPNQLDIRVSLNWKEEILKSHMILVNGTTEKTLTLRTTTPRRTTVLNATYDSKPLFSQHGVHFWWDLQRHLDHQIGYRITRRSANEASLELSLPTRTIRLDGHSQHGQKDVAVGAKVHWDVLKDPKKVIGLRVERFSNQTTYQGSLGLTHPQLSRELLLRGTIEASARCLFGSRLELLYSDDPREHLSLDGRVLDASEKGEGLHLKVLGHLAHPASGLNVDFSTNLTHRRYGDTTLDIRVVHLDQFGDLNTCSVRSQVKDRIWGLEFETPTHKWRSKSDFVDNETNWMIQLVHWKDEKEAFALDVHMDKKNILAEAAVRVSGDDLYQIQCGFESPMSFSLRAFGQNRDDITMSLLLPTPYYITYSLLWRTALLTDLKVVLVGASRSLAIQLQEETELWHSYLDDEIQVRAERLYEAIAEVANPMVIYTDNQMRLVAQDIQTLANDAQALYDENTFYLQDIISEEVIARYMNAKSIVDDAWEEVNEEFEGLCQALRSWWWSVNESARDALDALAESVEKMVDHQLTLLHLQVVQLAGEFADGLDTILMAAHNTLVAGIVNGARLLAFFVDQVRTRFGIIMETISNAWQAFKTFFVHHWIAFKNWFLRQHFYVWFRERALSIWSFLVDFWKEELYPMLSVQWKHLKVAFTPHKDSLVAILARAFCRLVNAIKDAWHRLVNYPPLLRLSGVIRALHQKILWTLDYFGLNAKWYKVLWRVYQTWQMLFQRRGYQTGVGFDSKNQVLFLPSKGILRFDQHMPMPWYALSQMPQFHQLPEAKTLRKVRTWFSTPRPSAWDLYYKYKPYLKPSTWLPPFPTYAILAGKQHYFTVDGRLYEFLGDCVYVLAHDFVGGNLTLAVNYASPAASLLIYVDGKEVEISEKVTINGKKVELPQKIGSTNILRDGSVVSISPSRGTLIQCNIQYHVCSLWMDGWYFGRTVGLFGTYNNEPNDDVVDPVTPEFLSEWEIGSGQCRSQPNKATSKHQTQTLCTLYFADPESSFKFCFDKVDPMPFKRACDNDVASSYDPDTSVCTSAVAYATACGYLGIPLAVPRHCVRCESTQVTSVFEGDSVTVKSGDVPPSTDVVFIFEARACNQRVVGKLPELVKSLEEAFANKNITENRYSLVAFGGDGDFDRPHVHTFDGEVFGNDRVFAASLPNIHFGNGMEDVFGALQFTSNLHFRPGVAKTFIVFVCSPCRQTSKQMDYPEVRRMLTEDGIQMHLVIDHAFNIKGSKDFFGIDAGFAYTLKNARSRKLDGDADLRRQVVVPKFICIPLALENNGTVFSTFRLIADSKRRSKSFLDVFSRRVAFTAHAPACQVCDCIPDGHGIATMICQSCFDPFGQGFDFLGSDYEDSLELFDDLSDRSKQKTKI